MTGNKWLQCVDNIAEDNGAIAYIQSTFIFQPKKGSTAKKRINTTTMTDDDLLRLAKDIYAAQQEIVIASPYLKNYRTMQMLKMLTAAKINGARVTVITRPVDSYKLADPAGVAALQKILADTGLQIIEKSNAHQKFAVIDQSIVWYGNINLLGYGSAEESIMRLEQKEIAEELLRAI